MPFDAYLGQKSDRPEVLGVAKLEKDLEDDPSNKFWLSAHWMELLVDMNEILIEGEGTTQ
jgi:hypothetical protein